MNDDDDDHENLFLLSLSSEIQLIGNYQVTLAEWLRHDACLLGIWGFPARVQISQATGNHQVALAEWLRLVPAKYMGFPGESSNLSGDDLNFFPCITYMILFLTFLNLQISYTHFWAFIQKG